MGCGLPYVEFNVFHVKQNGMQLIKSPMIDMKLEKLVEVE